MVDLVAQGYTLEKPEGLSQHRQPLLRRQRQRADGDATRWSSPSSSASRRPTCVRRLVLAPAQVATDPGACTVAVNNSNGKAGTCSGGGDGLASCTFNPVDAVARCEHRLGGWHRGRHARPSSCTSYVNVVDQELPSVSVSASPSHPLAAEPQVRTISLDLAKGDNCGTSAAAAPSSCTVTSNQPGGDWTSRGSTASCSCAPSAMAATTTGRIYTITCTATDSSGNTRTSTSTTVLVPHHDPVAAANLLTAHSGSLVPASADPNSVRAFAFSGVRPSARPGRPMCGLAARREGP